jgi:hypothetical protein
MNRLNLTSTDARTRIKVEINLRYREVQSGVNLSSTRRGLTTFTTASGVSTTTQSGIAKVLSVFDSTYLMRPLREISLNTIRSLDAPSLVQGIPYEFVVQNDTHDLITLRLFPQPNVVYNLQADVLLTGTDMSSDSDEPAFPDDYHDILVQGVVADELNKLEKFREGQLFEAKFEKRLSELRYFIRKSAWILGPKQSDNFMRNALTVRVWPYSNV